MINLRLILALLYVIVIVPPPNLGLTHWARQGRRGIMQIPQNACGGNAAAVQKALSRV